MMEIICKNKSCEFFPDDTCIHWNEGNKKCWEIESDWACPLCKGKPRKNKIRRVNENIDNEQNDYY